MYRFCIILRRVQASIACLLSLTLFAFGQDQAYKYVLDYNVPESPGLVALGVTPSKVLSGSVAKPVAASLLNQMSKGGRIESGIALDFNPYFTFGGGLSNIIEYRSNFIKRLLANLQVSIATIQAENDTSSLLFGVGSRITIFDDFDLLADTGLGNQIDEILMSEANADPGNEEDEISRKRVDVSSAYDNVRESMKTKTGSSLTFGWGLAGRMRGSVVNNDSIDNLHHRLWLSYKYHFSSNLDFLGMIQERYYDTMRPDHLIGAAIKANYSKVSLTLEALYGSPSPKWEIGGISEIKILPQVNLVTSISTEREKEVSDSPAKIKLRTMVKWNLGQ